MTKSKFTFKTDKATGAYQSFHPDHHYIKLKKIKIGSIGDKLPHYIKLMVVKNNIIEDGNSNCEWKWITLAHRSNSVADAKVWVNENIEALLEKYNLVKL